MYFLNIGSIISQDGNHTVQTAKYRYRTNDLSSSVNERKVP